MGRGEWVHVYVWLSPFAVHLKLTLLISYTPISNKKFLKKMVKKKEKAKVGVRKGKDLKHWRKKHLTGAPLRLEFGSRKV